ncbi:ABC transporter substrate-binding protein [Eubacterium multiforme]|uniref:Iron(III) transport system substrate-binding protein n=1 Tax=Eubacterium multiforme TaxID=83339 RepID=A0ABT9USV2_9FIRM|nr:ABC transporter substrate-binding protein [Eubacterium multiforme]MDQ0149408.1 iron(III) transport system substrate-binding protein [Eubacterium multiforme]
MKIVLHKKIFLIVILLIILVPIIYCLSPRKKENSYPNLKGKHLTVYVALREEEAKSLLEKFKKETGCTYEYIKLPTEEAVKRILDEKNSPNGDIFIGGTCDAYELLKSKNALAKYKSPNSYDIPSKYKDSQDYWTGFQLDTLAIGINKSIWNKEFASKGFKLPESFEDLLAPEYKGKIIMPSPETSGTGYTLLACLYQQLGESGYKNFIKKLKNNISSYTVSGFNSIQRVSSGEYAFTVDFLGDQLICNKSNPNIISITPKNTGWNVDSIAEINNCANKKVAEAFIDFILSNDTANNLSVFSKAISTKKTNSVTQNIYEGYSFKKAALERNNIMNIFNNTYN